MSLFPAFVNAKLRRGESTPSDEPAYHSDGPEQDDNIFNLLPPEGEPADVLPPEIGGGPPHPIDLTDLSRLSIDRQGRIYWDGKPVDTHHRLALSRRQVFAAGVVAVFIVIGAIGAAIQGAAVARDWACQLGWAAGACPMTPHGATDIPA